VANFIPLLAGTELPDFEIVLIDDASRPSLDILRGFEKKTMPKYSLSVKSKCD
jgi:hypothetical protein